SPPSSGERLGEGVFVRQAVPHVLKRGRSTRVFWAHILFLKGASAPAAERRQSIARGVNRCKPLGLRPTKNEPRSGGSHYALVGRSDLRFRHEVTLGLALLFG